MNKYELISVLENIEGNPRIVMASDEEGNSFSDLYEVGFEETDDEDSSLLFEFGAPLIVLWP